MKEKSNLSRGLSRAAWGYLFIYLDINLGRVNILPEFVGMSLFLSAVELLRHERRELELLRPLVTGLTAFYTVEWCFSWAGISLEGRFALLTLLLSAASLYFHFQFFTDLAAIAEKYELVEESRRILKWRTAQTVLITASAVLCHPFFMAFRSWEGVMLGVSIVGCFIGFCLMMILFSLSKALEET